jgi:hypothetical protein
MTERIALAEATVPILGEGRVVRHRIFEIKVAEPAIGQIQMDFFAQPALRADAEAVAHDQHADHQLRIDRWAARVAVERREVIAQFSEVEEAIDAAQQVIAWDVIVEVE